MVNPYDFILTGLTLDVAGGLMLAKGFMLKGLKVIVREGVTRSGGNGAFVTSALLQQSEAWLGGTLLTLGFGAQMWGNLHGGPSVNDLGYINSPSRLAVLGVVVAAVSYVAMWVGHRYALSRRDRHFAGPEKWNV
jgi:hypothetical protein